MKRNEEEKQSLFLDTSILISRKGENSNEITKINKFIKEYNFISTSSYTRLEFKQSYIEDLVYIHNILVNKCSYSELLFRQGGLGGHRGHARKISNISTALGGFFKPANNFYSGSKDDRDLAEKIALYLELIIENSWETFEDSVDHLSDSTKCIRSKEPPKKKKFVFDNKIKRCKSEKIHCKLNEFFEKKRRDFVAIRDYINKLSDSEKKNPPELNKIVLTIEEGLGNSDNLCNTAQCRRLGDALVAVEAIHFKELYTKDVDQAKVVCKPIQLKSNLLN